MKNKSSVPKVWFLFLAIIIQFVLMQGTQILSIETLQFLRPDIDRMNPSIFIPVRIVGHLVGASVIILVAYRISSRYKIPLLNQFRLMKPLIPTWQILVLGMASFAVAFLAGKLANSIFGTPTIESSALSFFEQLTPSLAILHVLITGLLPGFFEEITFRGFLQHHLTGRLGVFWAILLMSLAFGLVHVEPRTIVLSTTMGVWLGIVAWRVGSIWPTIIGHFVINALNSFYMSGKYVWGFPETPPSALQWGVGIVSFSALVYSVWILLRLKPHRVISFESSKT